jgi:hypothetical protein
MRRHWSQAGGPGHAVLVDQETHQLGNADRRVGIVEMDRHLLGQIAEAAVLGQMANQDVLQRCGRRNTPGADAVRDQQRSAVIRVEDPGDVLETILELGGALVVAGIEGTEVDLRRRRRLPQAQGADPLGAMTGDDVVESLGFHRIGGMPFRPFSVMFGIASEAHGIMLVGARELPWRTILQPGFRLLDLLAVDNRLRKHAVFIADAIAPGGQSQGGHRIEKAGRQPAQTTVAERRVRLAFDHLVERRAGWCEHTPLPDHADRVPTRALFIARPIRNSIDR